MNTQQQPFRGALETTTILRPSAWSVSSTLTRDGVEVAHGDLSTPSCSLPFFTIYQYTLTIYRLSFF